MGIRSWLSKLRGPSDEAMLERAGDMADEAPDEQVVLSGDLDAVKADVKTGSLGGASVRDYERLGE